MNKPAVSVVIPTYNRAHLICESLDSIFAQTFKDYEVIVVDDGSTDNTAEVLSPYMARIRYLKQENGGVAAARNRGMLAAEGEFVAFLDSDDLWLPTKLEKQVALLRQRGDVQLCYTDMYLAAQPDEKPRQTLFDAVPYRGNTLLKTLLIQSTNLTPSVVFRRSILPSVGLFDTVLTCGEDYDFFLRIAAKHSCAYVDECLVFVRDHPHRSLRAELPHVRIDYEGRRHPACPMERRSDHRRLPLTGAARRPKYGELCMETEKRWTDPRGG